MKKENTMVEELNETEFKVYELVHMDGCYRFGKETINCTKFSIAHKPKRIHRFFMRVILGLYWEDNKS